MGFCQSRVTGNALFKISAILWMVTLKSLEKSSNSVALEAKAKAVRKEYMDAAHNREELNMQANIDISADMIAGMGNFGSIRAQIDLDKEVLNQKVPSEPDDSSKKPLVYFRRLPEPNWHGPSELLSWGRGFASVSTGDGEVLWVPARCVKAAL
ncbi:hypothetical protein lerEdw1_001871 [Lerista edwardsae]|nr:hypothetical protein lerEdw1_001871 [Lerista edwardsae]